LSFFVLEKPILILFFFVAATSDLFEQFENDPKAANSTLSMIEKAISTSQQSLMKSARLANDKSALLAALASSKYNKSSKSNPMKRNRYDSDEEFEEPGDEVELKDGGGEPASTTSNSSSPPKAKQPASAAAVSAANNIDRVPVTFTATSNGNIPQVAGPPFGIINWSEHRLYYLCRVEEQTVMKIRVFADESYVELQFISPPPTKDELFEAGITPLEPTGGNFTYFVRAVVPDYAILDSSHTHRFESKSFKGVWFETKYQEPEPLGPKPVFEV
jgi:hypothetical protein